MKPKTILGREKKEGTKPIYVELIICRDATKDILGNGHSGYFNLL